MNDIFYVPDPQPFWFIESELLRKVLGAEISIASRLLSHSPELPCWFDNPETGAKQRKICFAVAARSKVIFNVSDTIASRYDPSGQLTNEEADTFRRMSNLIAPDAPTWALEMERVIDRIPSHMFAALPESLRKERFEENDAEQAEAIKGLSKPEQIQVFIQSVLDEQIRRLASRWKSDQQQRASKPQPKGFEGLGPKRNNLSQYMNGLSEKQKMAVSLKYEYELTVVEVASRMELARKTVYGHLDAAKRTMEQDCSNQKRKAQRATKNPSESAS